MMPTIGQMRWTVQFDKATKTSDGSGGQNESYAQFYITKAYLKKLSGFRTFQSGYDTTVNRYEMWCKWRHALEVDVNKDMRVIFDNRFFSITHYDLVDENRSVYHFELTEVK
jgi:SPP1 family predicted phage head-tail adaptor